MNAPMLFTVGHSNHEMPALLDLLRQHGITLLADVRSSPHSRYNSQFNREALQAALQNCGIGYVFLGRELGARREERECYLGPKVQYARVARLPVFKQGLDYLREAVTRKRVALLCAEKDPLACHRTILICRQLRSDDISISHIRDDGTVETHAEAENRLLALMNMPSGSLFQSKEELIEEAYDRQGERIAFVESPEREGEPAELSY